MFIILCIIKLNLIMIVKFNFEYLINFNKVKCNIILIDIEQSKKSKF